MDKGISLGMNATALSLTGEAKFRAFRRLANLAASASTFTGAAGRAENATYSLVRCLSATYMAEGVMEQSSATSTDIFGQIDAIDAVILGEMDYARQICDGELFLALSKFRADANSQMYDKAYNSPGVAKYNFGGRVHPLNAAYSIFGDAKRHREIEAMNVVSSSGKVGPGVFSVTR